jgi:hypothetical protein
VGVPDAQRILEPVAELVGRGVDIPDGAAPNAAAPATRNSRRVTIDEP